MNGVQTCIQKIIDYDSYKNKEEFVWKWLDKTVGIKSISRINNSSFCILVIFLNYDL